MVTMDADRREIPGGWVSATGGFVTAVGEPGQEPEARDVIDASGCLVTPGLVNTHHHMFQNLTRAFAPALGGSLFDWLRVLYPSGRGWTRRRRMSRRGLACANWHWAGARPPLITSMYFRRARAT